MDVIPEIRRLHFVEHVTISDLAKPFKLSRPTLRKHLKTVEEPVYPTRQYQPYLKRGALVEQLTTWLETGAALQGNKRKRTAQRWYKCRQVAGYVGGYSAVPALCEGVESVATCESDDQTSLRATAVSGGRDVPIRLES